MRRLVLLVAAAVAIAAPAAAQTPRCEALEGDDKALADELLGALKPYECCSDSIAKCLTAKPRCPVAVRLANDVCRSIQLGRDKAAVQKGFEQRRQSMTGGQAAGFALEDAARLGDAAAPVTVVVYACSRCPYCRDMVLALQDQVANGDLAGKVKLYLRPFPLKNHDGATEGDLALMAAQRLGSLWPYAQVLFRRFSEFHPSVLADWAKPAGLDTAAFEKAMADEKTRELLTESRKEGLRNKVDSTPTVFIDGRRYSYDLDPAVLVDVLLEEYERVTAKQP